jgi:ribosomal protein L11 methyltransferase
MRKLTLTIAAGDLDDVLDRLLPLVPQGVHDLPAGDDRLELAVYGPAPPREALEAAVGPALLQAAESDADDDPFQRRMEAHARRAPIGGRLVVRPEGAPPAGEGLLDVVIEGPGGAFGAGTHPTTEMCLELLLGLEPGGSFADLGCGTGVLAIVAVKLGWSPVVALDHEQVAIDATKANARRNGVELDAWDADLLEVPPPPVTTLAANVPPKVHERLAEELAPVVRTVIVSGVVDDHLPGIVAGYERAGFVLATQIERRSWCAALLVRDA